ncbi:MAG: hypothetical protein QXM75_02410 [Candidatus Diapherotrites archaeon]
MPKPKGERKRPLKRTKERIFSIRKLISDRYRSIGLKFMLNAIEWAEKEGKITSDKAMTLREKVESKQAHDFLTSFGAHMILDGIPGVTIGMGPIARPSYTLIMRLKAAYNRYVRKKISYEEYKRLVELHSGEAIIIGAIPILGGSAYIVSNFIRDPDLMNVVCNYLARKTLGEKLYRTLRLNFVIEKVTSGAKSYYLIKAYIGGKVKKVYPKQKK